MTEQIQRGILPEYDGPALSRRESRDAEGADHRRQVLAVLREHEVLSARALARHLGRHGGREVCATLRGLRATGAVGSMPWPGQGRALWFPKGTTCATRPHTDTHRSPARTRRGDREPVERTGDQGGGPRSAEIRMTE